MKLCRRLLCALLLLALLIPAAAAAPALGGGTKRSDIQGHWAQQQIEQAVSEGWVDGYPDGSFHPDDTITQAEFTKLLLAAFQLTPDSDTVAWMKSIAAYPHDKGGYMDIEPYTPTLSDMKGHWLTKQGWLDAAIYSGILVPADHTGGKYGPDLPVRRYTMALQAIRAMGFVGAAETVSTADLAFSDNAEIQEWVKGYVKLATQYGVMNGYPDGSFGPKRTATRAEAVVTVARALDYNRGDGEIQASMELYRYFAYPHGSESAEPFVTNRVRMLAADGRIYVNARDLFTEIGVDGGWRWFPTRQVLYVSGGNTSYKFQMGMTTGSAGPSRILLTPNRPRGTTSCWGSSASTMGIPCSRSMISIGRSTRRRDFCGATSKANGMRRHGPSHFPSVTRPPTGRDP